MQDLKPTDLQKRIDYIKRKNETFSVSTDLNRIKMSNMGLEKSKRSETTRNASYAVHCVVGRYIIRNYLSLLH